MPIVGTGDADRRGFSIGSPSLQIAVVNEPIWDDGEWAPLPALTTDVEADVCVIGLGGSGLACILELLARGRRVIGLDAGVVGGGAAGRNGGFLLAGAAPFYHDAVAAYGRDRARAMYRLTLAEIDRLAAELPGIVRIVGSLRIGLSAAERDDCAAQLAAMRDDDLPVEPYEGTEGMGLLMPADGVVQPLARCRTLARRAVAAGARLFEHSAAALDAGDGRVRVGSAVVRCDQVVVAVDGRLDRVLPELASRVRTARLQMLATAPTPEVHYPRPVYARYGYEYWQQLPDGRVALGGFRDHGGDAEWTTEALPSDVIQDALEHFLRDQLGVTAPITHRWAGAVGYTRDALPVVEEVRPGVWAIGGYSGHGNVIGSLLGRAVARRVAGEVVDDVVTVFS